MSGLAEKNRPPGFESVATWAAKNGVKTAFARAQCHLGKLHHMRVGKRFIFIHQDEKLKEETK